MKKWVCKICGYVYTGEKLLLPNLKNRLRANLFGLMSTESALLKA